MQKQNLIKQRLLSGHRMTGMWCSIGSPTLAEAAALAGWEIVMIDLEHGPAAISTAVDMMRAIEAARALPMVRVPWNDPVFLKRILDAGAQSLMIPMVQTAAEAAAAVHACRYPPAGGRGYAATAARASGYGTIADYFDHANDHLLIVAQIESAAAVENIPGIAAVDGIDMLFIGANDMAGSIGRLEQLDHPDVTALIVRAQAAITASGKPMGTVPRAGADLPDLLAAGHTLVLGPTDIGLYREAAQQAATEWRAVIDSVNG